jgi:hypothetical protein
MDFFAVPLPVSGALVITAAGVPTPLPADCRRTGIFDMIGELLLLTLLVGEHDDDVDDVDDADDEL